jgi:hypothetical protein
MQHTPRETSPRTAQTTQPGDVHRAGFESVLPPDVFDELIAPRRPRILGRPVKGPHGRRAIVLVVLVLVLVAAGIVVALVSWQRPAAAPAAAPDPILEHSKALLAAQETQPVPGWQSDGTAYGRAGIIGQPAPRAQLVRIPTPAPRAKLVRLPIFLQYRLSI